MDRSEPCDRCGDETAVGSKLYPGRHQGRQADGAEVFRCGECAARDLARYEHDGSAGGTDWLIKSMPGVSVRQNW